MSTVTNPDGDDLAYYYDYNGYLASIDDFTGSCYITNSYNGHGQVETQVLGDTIDGNVSTVSYDSQATVNTFITSSGRKTEYRYDSTGNVTHIDTYFLNGSQIYVLQESKDFEDGRLMRHADCEGSETIYERNDMGQATRVVYPDGSEETFAYNADHLLVIHAFAGCVIEYE